MMLTREEEVWLRVFVEAGGAAEEAFVRHIGRRIANEALKMFLKRFPAEVPSKIRRRRS